MIMKKCYICKVKFEHVYNKIYRKDRDHCRYTSKWRGAPHSICDLRQKKYLNKPIVYFENDYHKRASKRFWRTSWISRKMPENLEISSL